MSQTSPAGEVDGGIDPANKELSECPTCGREDFVSDNGIRQHHKIAHGESIKVELTCEVCDTDYKRHPSQVGKGRVCSVECAGEIVSSELSGENHYNWKGGEHDYRGCRWKRQRTRAKERDGYYCQDCGALRPLHVHHKTPCRTFDDPNNAHDLDNLVTLCEGCHQKRHQDTE